MSRTDWQGKLNWTEDNIDDLEMAGYHYIRQGKYEIACNFFRALVVLRPNDAYDLQTLGALYLQLDDPVKALEYFDKSLQLEADHAPTLLNITKALLALGKKEEALRLAKILSNEPNSKVANTAKALLLAWG